MKKILSMFLVTVMLFGMFASLNIFAARGDDDEEDPAPNDYDHLTEVFETPAEKIATMELKMERYGYQIYYDSISGEVAYVNALTGQALFTNPYDIAAPFGVGKSIATAEKQQLMSQLLVTYKVNGVEKTMNSYVDAAMRGQINQTMIKNGIRVEYTIGQMETRSLVPRQINKERFENEILAYITDERAAKRIMNYYSFKNPYEDGLSESSLANMYRDYPITQQMAIYVFDASASTREINDIEQIIKLYCPHYTYEELAYDHELTEYKSDESDPPQFKMALEYTLTEDGIEVRLPANGIRYNEASYTLSSIVVLPYFGCGSNKSTGYSFFPDGSGTIVRFEELTNERTLLGKMYGYDYAYHTISGARNAAPIRMPVYGLVQNLTTYHEESHEETVGGYYDSYGTWVEEQTVIKTETVEDEQSIGYFAIVQEGDALASITSSNGAGVKHPYSTVYTEFNPRPQDSYNLADAISASDSQVYNVISKRKYTGNYRILFTMLQDDALCEDHQIASHYECSYVGMAEAYRDYLEKNGILTRLTDADVEEDIPLFVESFGSISASGTFLSFPITVQKPLTTFDDLITMYDRMAERGITNVNFRLTGFANGGLDSAVPNHVSLDKAVGGTKGYEKFKEYASEKGFDFFFNFDPSYSNGSAKNTNGFSNRDAAVKTIDGRYTLKQEYSSSYQSLMYVGKLVLSPSYFGKMYNGLHSDLSKLGAANLSLSTLGSDLSSDFNEDNPLTRENSKKHVVNTLEQAASDYTNLMLDGGNAYAWKYATQILNAPLDSSHYTYANETIPFFGMVLHGYVEIAGSPTNMVGDINYEILKLIENGAAPYFTLSYQNTIELKDSDYYSVSFDNWIDDLSETYEILNDALRDVQTSIITNHEFLNGQRVPTDKELTSDEETLRLAEEAIAAAAADAKAEADRKQQYAEIIAALTGKTIDVTSTGNSDNSNERDAIASLKEELSKKYAVNDGSIVRVTYENGTVFILNYNTFDVVVDGITISAYNFTKVSA